MIAFVLIFIAFGAVMFFMLTSLMEWSWKKFIGRQLSNVQLAVVSLFPFIEAWPLIELAKEWGIFIPWTITIGLLSCAASVLASKRLSKLHMLFSFTWALALVGGVVYSLAAVIAYIFSGPDHFTF